MATTTKAGREFSVSDKQEQVYPQREAHTWSEFAGLAIEMGGYGDLTAIDPYTGRRFWLGSAFRCDEHAAALTAAEPGDAAMAVYAATHECAGCNGTTVLAAIRRLLDAMEEAGFPDNFR